MNLQKIIQDYFPGRFLVTPDDQLVPVTGDRYFLDHKGNRHVVDTGSDACVDGLQFFERIDGIEDWLGSLPADLVQYFDRLIPRWWSDPLERFQALSIGLMSGLLTQRKKKKSKAREMSPLAAVHLVERLVKAVKKARHIWLI